MVGLARLRDKLYVIYHQSDTIVVYEAESPYTRLQDIPVNGLKYPLDMAACVNSGSLYIVDTHTVWRIGVNQKSVKKWKKIESVKIRHFRHTTGLHDLLYVVSFLAVLCAMDSDD